MVGVESIRCLTFTESQAEINRSRREEILRSADPNWVPPQKINFRNKIKARYVKKRSSEDDEGQEVVSFPKIS